MWTPLRFGLVFGHASTSSMFPSRTVKVRATTMGDEKPSHGFGDVLSVMLPPHQYSPTERHSLCGLREVVLAKIAIRAIDLGHFILQTRMPDIPCAIIVRPTHFVPGSILEALAGEKEISPGFLFFPGITAFGTKKLSPITMSRHGYCGFRPREALNAGIGRSLSMGFIFQILTIVRP